MIENIEKQCYNISGVSIITLKGDTFMFQKNIVKELKGAAGVVFVVGIIASMVIGACFIPAGTIISLSLIIGGVVCSYAASILICGLSELISETKKTNKLLDELLDVMSEEIEE